mmetsp:Transcript_50767/g.164176  ORF Transcript_50767/g.164176 Transcript_50767/m.164176 type:complete len:204 (-) Transcript_50767:102-713(-)
MFNTSLELITLYNSSVFPRAPLTSTIKSPMAIFFTSSSWILLYSCMRPSFNFLIFKLGPSKCVCRATVSKPILFAPSPFVTVTVKCQLLRSERGATEASLGGSFVGVSSSIFDSTFGGGDSGAAGVVCTRDSGAPCASGTSSASLGKPKPKALCGSAMTTSSFDASLQQATHLNIAEMWEIHRLAVLEACCRNAKWSMKMQAS